jgi:sec-independent protein translocase protein TatA
MIGDLFDSPWKILIVAVVIIVLFGSKKLPDAARSLGKSMRILKTEVSDMHHDEADKGTPPAALPAQPAPPKLTESQAQQQHIEQLQQQINNLQQQQANGAAVTETPQTQQPG